MTPVPGFRRFWTDLIRLVGSFFYVFFFFFQEQRGLKSVCRRVRWPRGHLEVISRRLQVTDVACTGEARGSAVRDVPQALLSAAALPTPAPTAPAAPTK